ncbi:MAG: transglycosylase domain-containing protein, partial [Rhodospirillales bacterium]
MTAKTTPKAKAKPKAAPRKVVKPAAKRAAKPATEAKAGASGGILWPLVKWSLTIAVWGMIAVVGLLAWYAYDLPDVDAALAETRQPVMTVLAADGTAVARRGQLFGGPATLSDMPRALPQAVIATEDRRFYDHPGLDPIGLARAMATNVMAGGIRQGGSTLTQQLAKNLFLSPDRTLKRKVQEVLLAFWLEARFSKDQILTVYLNRVYFGAGAWGAEAASRRYFGKP